MAARKYPPITQEMIDFLKMTDMTEDYEPSLRDDISYADFVDDFDFDDFDDDIPYLHSRAACPTCKRNYNIVHSECGEYVDLCTCQSPIDPVYHCFACDTSFSPDEGEIKLPTYTKNSLFEEIEPKQPKKSSGVYGNWEDWTWNGKTCSHKHDKIEISEGYFVYCSSVNYEPANSEIPDFGLYADYSWRPTWRNEFINWPDYNKPKDQDTALVQIVDAYERILNGEMVEIGCIGGHGRTGTILACLYLLAQEGKVSPTEAFTFVKKNYCEHAIESNIQEWFINYASYFWYDTELPAEPPKIPKSSNHNSATVCQMVDHFSMMIRGWTICPEKGESCPFWKKDQDSFKSGDYTEVIENANKIENLKKYDYIYGGLMLFTDPVDSPCKPIDHYSMILNGHESCIRLGDACSWWDKDFKEYCEKSTINSITLSEWNQEADRVKFYLELYPKAEELKKNNDR